MEIKYADIAWKLIQSELPQEEVIAGLQDLVKKVERHILNVTGPDPLNQCCHDWLRGNAEEYQTIEELILDRMVIMNMLFKIHCSDEEVERIKLVNNHLYNLTKELHRKTADTYRMLLQWPRDDGFTDDINIGGSIKYCCESESGFIRLEDDDFYGSDFGQMLAVISATENDNMLDIVSTYCFWCPDEVNANMSDKELGVEDTMDDGESWNEGFKDVPQLNDIVFCYAVHDICNHRSYSIPDLMRMNNFTAEVKIEIQNIRETDGSSQDWWEKCTKEQFVDKYIKESEHRPKGMSLAEFLWKRLDGLFDRDWLESQGVVQVRPSFKSDEKAVEYLSEYWDNLQPLCEMRR